MQANKRRRRKRISSLNLFAIFRILRDSSQFKRFKILFWFFNSHAIMSHRIPKIPYFVYFNDRTDNRTRGGFLTWILIELSNLFSKGVYAIHRNYPYPRNPPFRYPDYMCKYTIAEVNRLKRRRPFLCKFFQYKYLTYIVILFVYNARVALLGEF